MGRADYASAKACLPGSVEEAKGNGGRSPTALSDLPTPSRGGRARDATTNGAGAKARCPASALEDLMRRKGVDEAWNALDEMQQQGLTTDKYTVSRMLMKTVGDGRTRLNPSRVYRSISLVEKFIAMQPKDVDEVLFNALLDTCCRLKDLNRLETILNRMRELKVTPSPVTLGILVKTYGQAGDLQKVLNVWNEMEQQREQANAVTYGCMIDACVKCGNLEKAVEIFTDMKVNGKHRNTILYTTLIKGYGLDKDLPNAIALFREMPGEGVPYNTITYNSILDACVKCGDLTTAEGLLRELCQPENSLEPDLISFSTMLKGYCNIANIDKALQVAEAIKARGLRADELVYNTLMDGCVKANDINAGVGLFEEMIQSGMQPSAITHSILARLYQRAGYQDDAIEAVAHLYQQHGLDRPNFSDRGGKGSGKRCNQRSPNSRTGDRYGNHSATQSPIASPASSVASGFDAAWAPFRNMPQMPGFDGHSAVSSAATTPMGSPQHTHGQPSFGMDAARGQFVPPLPGTAPQLSPYGQATGSAAPMFFMGQHGTPQQCMDQQFGFGMQQQQGGYSAAQQLPPWPFQCGSTVPAPPPHAPSAGDAVMQQMMSVPMNCAAPPPPPTQMPGVIGQPQQQQQAYFEGWTGGAMQMNGMGDMGGNMFMGGDGSCMAQGQFLS